VIDLANSLSRFPVIGFDTESSGPVLPARRKSDEFLNVYRSSLTGLSISTAEHDYYVPVGHRKNNCDLQAFDKLSQALKAYPGVAAIHSLKHEMKAVRYAPRPLTLPSRSACTQVLCWITQRPSNQEKRPYGLKQLSKTYLGIEQATFDETTNGLDFSQLDPCAPKVIKYACDDALAARLLWEKFSPELFQHHSPWDSVITEGKAPLWEWYWDVEMPFLGVLSDMEDAGVALDEEKLLEAIRAFQAEASDLEDEWAWLLPKTVKIGSSKTLQWLYSQGEWDSTGLPKGKSGAISTKKEHVKSQLSRCKPGSVGYEAARIKLRHSGLTKLCTTYGQALLDRAWSYPDLRVHASFNPTGTATGRLSSNDPNMQNLPARSAEGKRIREAVVAAPGRTLLSADYSQIELRVLAHLLGSGPLFSAYHRGDDVHEVTAREVGVERGVAKNLNFLVVYGGGARKLAETGGGLSLAEAKEALSRFQERYSDIFTLKDRMIAAAEKRGFIRTLSGRFRRLDIRKYRNQLEAVQHLGRNSQVRKDAWARLGGEERKAPNTAVQGSAGDIMKLGMLAFHRNIDLKRCRPVIQVHDDLVTECDVDYLDEAREILKHSLENAYKLKVPLVVAPADGERWSLHK
jgi:DNA polymerase-1